MDDVDFDITTTKWYSNNIDITAAPGEKIAFVGSTGAGKLQLQTLLTVFMIFRTANRYDGININKIKSLI